MQRRLCVISEAKCSITEAKCLQWICKCYAFQRNAITSNCLSVAKSHPAGMQICYAIFAGISLRLCSISLRSFRITFAAYLPTHIKFLWDFLQSSLNIWLQGRPVVQFQKRKPISAGRDRLYLYRLFLCECKNYLMPSSAFTFADTSSIELPL